MYRTLLGAAVGAGAYFAYRAIKPRYEFRNRHVLITGGSRGLGLVMARRLGACGARVTICSRDPAELVRAEADLIARGAQAIAVECDVTSAGRVDDMVTVARRLQGPIDVLINNAGVIQVGPMDQMRLEDYEQSLAACFWAALYTTRAVIPEMKARRCGRIVNIASMGGKVAVPHLLPYSAGKFALVGFSQGLRAELAKYGIVVTTVCPGLMRTGSHLNAQFKGQHEKEYRWFAAGGSLPFLSMNADRAARKILESVARGDAEFLLGWSAKLAVAMNAVCPNLTSNMLSLIDRWILPDPAGSSTKYASGKLSRGRLPGITTVLSDRAAASNNEVEAAVHTPCRPAGSPV